MGTHYHITYQDAQSRNFKSAIDQLLYEINMEVSVYEKDALISQFNKVEKSIVINDGSTGKQIPATHFLANFEEAKLIHKATTGFFDPTVMPLVNYWGFGYTPRELTKVDSNKVEALAEIIGFDQINLKNENGQIFLTKENPNSKLDFGAIAKGYGVDAIASLLNDHEISNYMVEIGGEVFCNGLNSKGKLWTLAINTPDTKASIYDAQAIIAIKNKGLATSGNYRNFYELNGAKISHTINPKTGFPERSELLSTTVVARNCMVADAYATAFMTMGLERAFLLANELPGLEAYFIYGGKDGEMKVQYSTGFEPFLNKSAQ